MTDFVLVHRVRRFVVNPHDPEEVCAADTGLRDMESIPLEKAPDYSKKTESRIRGFNDLDGTVKLKAFVPGSGISKKE
jgi:hypothetical protein